MNKFDLSVFDLNQGNLSIVDNRLYVIKTNWDYELSWNFQKKAQELLDVYKSVIIFTSHPAVLTHGRGLQKSKGEQDSSLKEFDPSLKDQLPYPLFQIERGGGLTFHHPGQWIVYPIMRLHPEKMSLSPLVDDLLGFTKDILADFAVKDLTVRKDLLGLWHDHFKLASVGIAAHRFKTMHGLALNLNRFDEIKKKLSFLAPCGMSFNTYTSLEELGFDITHEQMTHQFIQRINHAWK